MKIIKAHTIIVGAGASAYNAADCLFNEGLKDVLMICERESWGTSRNAGSDKQTYYKLSLCGKELDSVFSMARTYFEGLAVDGEHALCEAALSTQCFYKLVELGVPFPRGRYGEFVGYKTDHDPNKRATSAGPYTSLFMTEALQRQVKAKGIHVYSGFQLIDILIKEGNACGCICLGLDDNEYTVFQCVNLILATGGPAHIYSKSVYPVSQKGATGVAFSSGVQGKNLTEWQFGLASLKPRWNVSGTYMQALPRFVSTDAEGKDEKEFLFCGFDDVYDVLSKIFLKGYQWPFDVRKVEKGSSIIDVLVYWENQKGRRVFLDYTRNPLLLDALEYDLLSKEAYQYLETAGALGGMPFDRLQKMNEPAIEFYRSKGVDLHKQMLEISLCAQHSNGGIAVDLWWQTDVKHLFAVGECAATHGVYRPGGSALNAGQVGSMRASEYISRVYFKNSFMDDESFQALAQQHLASLSVPLAQKSNIEQVAVLAQEGMSQTGGAIRNEKALRAQLAFVEKALNTLSIQDKKELFSYYEVKDILLTQRFYLFAMIDYINHGHKSRGSALYTDPKGNKPHCFLPDDFSFSLEKDDAPNEIQLIQMKTGKPCAFWRPVHPIPSEEEFFENVWREFRKNGNVF